MFGSTRKKLQKQSSADRVSTKFVVPQNLHWIEKREFFSILFGSDRIVFVPKDALSN